MPDRLAELRRQRALLLEHLAWLEREIEETSGRKNPPSTSLPAPGTSPAQTPGVAAALVVAALKAHSTATSAEPPAVAAAEAMLEEYRVPSDSLKTDVRKGCFLYFTAAFLLVLAVVAVLYFALSRN